jgi:hypothetical protein
MEKKTVKPVSVKIVLAKPLKLKLIAAVHKVLNDNEAELTDEIKKVVKKSVKRIAKKTDAQINKALKPR